MIESLSTVITLICSLYGLGEVAPSVNFAKCWWLSKALMISAESLKLRKLFRLPDDGWVAKVTKLSSELEQSFCGRQSKAIV